MLVFGDLLGLECLTLKISAEHESAIILDVTPVETEEIVLGFEVTDLQDAIDLSMDAWPAACERQFIFGQGQVFQALRIVKVRQAIQRLLLGIRQNC